jgi:hypothetical protein
MRHLKRYSQLFENSQELTQDQREWLDKCSVGGWELNSETGLVDVDGNFYCENQNLTDFKGVRFGSVKGYFNCPNNQLTSLEGAPKSVGVTFNVYNNRLVSLDGAPQIVGLSFNCANNSLTSLEGAPHSVGNYFDCSNNSLTSLVGAPEKIVGSFNCSNNSLTSFKGAPLKLSEGFNFSHNFLTSLEGAPRVGYSSYLDGIDNPISEKSIKGVIKRMSDKEISLEQAVAEYWKSIPKDDRLYLAKHNPNLSPEDKRGYEALLKFRDKII